MSQKNNGDVPVVRRQLGEVMGGDRGINKVSSMVFPTWICFGSCVGYSPEKMKYVQKMLDEAGFGIEAYEKRVISSQGLVSRDVADFGLKNGGNLEILIQDAQRVPEVVKSEGELGRVSFGVIDSLRFDEYSLIDSSKRVKVKWNYAWADPNALFGRPALCLIGMDNEPSNRKDNFVYVPPEYELTARKYLSESPRFKGKQVGLVVYGREDLNDETIFEKIVEMDGKAMGILEIYDRGDLINKRGYQKEVLIPLEAIGFSDLLVISSKALELRDRE